MRRNLNATLARRRPLSGSGAGIYTALIHKLQTNQVFLYCYCGVNYGEETGFASLNGLQVARQSSRPRPAPAFLELLPRWNRLTGERRLKKGGAATHLNATTDNR